MFASVDWAAAGTIAALCLSIVGGGLTMAWRLGRLEEKVSDTQSDVKEIREAINEEVRDRLGRGHHRRHPF